MPTETITLTSSPDITSTRMQTYFQRKLLQHAVNELRLNQFAQKADLPRLTNTKTIRFFRKREADASLVHVLATEGTTTTNYTQVALSNVDVTLKQFGQLTKISDVMQIIDAFDPVNMHIATMGEDCALHVDTITRNAVLGVKDTSAVGTINPFYANEVHLGYADGAAIVAGYTAERAAGVPFSEPGADFATLQGISATNGRLTRARALGCLTILKTNKAPKINGNYVAIICPQVEHDLLQDEVWLNAVANSQVDRLWNGEVGRMDGCRYISCTNPWREDDTYGVELAVAESDRTIYTTLFLGKDAFGAPKMGGTISPYSPSFTMLNKADKTDPLNQYMMAGYKLFWGATLLNQSFIVALRSKSTFNA